MFDIRNNNTINKQNEVVNKLKITLNVADNQNHNLKFAKVLPELRKSRVLKPTRSVIKNIEGAAGIENIQSASIQFYTTNTSKMNDIILDNSISKTRSNLPRIVSAESV